MGIGDLQVEIRNRSIGGLTGFRLAGALGRVPVEEAVSSRHEAWKEHGFNLDADRSLTICTYVDNLYSASASVGGAIQILEDAAQHIHTTWGQCMKPSSRLLMPCRGNSDELPDVSRWKVVKIFPALGHLIQDDSQVRACFNATRAAMWRAFWATCRHHSVKSAPLDVKLLLLSRACIPILSYRCSRWPPSNALAIELDRLQAKMVAAIARTARLPGEPLHDYCRRRRRLAAALCRRHGLWSQHWYKRVVDWDGHLARGHAEHSWPVQLRSFHGEHWLDAHRAFMQSRGTMARMMRGRPAQRWHDGVNFARQQLAQ